MAKPFEGVIGEIVDGVIVTEAHLCAVSGLPVLMQHHVMQTLGDNRHFVRVMSQLAPRLTPEMCDAFLASVTPKSKAEKPVEAGKDKN